MKSNSIKFKLIPFVASDYGLALITLLVMSVQILAVEGFTVSMPKVVFMAMTPLFLICKAKVVTRALLFSSLYFFVTLSMLFIQFGSVRTSTLYYTALFLCTFNLYYALIYYKHAFELDDFILIIKGLIFAYAICLFLQQVCFLVGIRYLPFINLMGLDYYELFRLNSLAIEPSHAARLLTVYYYALLKLSEVKYGGVVPLSKMWNEHKKVTTAFLYSMFFMGSGTAFVGLAILSLYFLRKQYAIVAVVGAFLIYMIIPLIHYEPLERAVNTFDATLTGNTELVAKADGSASTRVNVILNTFKLDIFDADTWLGLGTEHKGIDKGAYAIANYGLISYIFKLIFFFSCCFSGFLTLETLMFVLLFLMDVGNVAYGYSMLMVFSTVKYFQKYYHANNE